MSVIYQVLIGFESRTATQFRVGSVVAPSVNAPGYDRISGLFLSSFGGTYDDVSALVEELDVKRGGAQTGGIQSGSMDVVLLDKTRLFDPDNLSSPINGLVDVMLPCVARVSVNSGVSYEDLAWGWLRTGDFDYDWGEQTAKFTFEDVFAWLDRFKEPGPIIAEQGLIYADDALSLILDEMKWPKSQRVMDSGSLLGSFSGDGDKGAADLMKEVLDVDGGTVFQDRQGRFVYRNSYATAFDTSAATLDNGQGARPGLAADNVKNVAKVTKEGGTEQVYQDPTSVTKYGPSGAGALTSAMIRDDAHALTIAKRLVKFTKDSRYRFWDYQLMADTTAMLTTLAQLDYSDLITVNGRDYNIVSLQHSRKGGEAHMTSYTLEEHIPHPPPFKIGSSHIAPAANTPGYDVVVG